MSYKNTLIFATATMACVGFAYISCLTFIFGNSPSVSSIYTNSFIQLHNDHRKSKGLNILAPNEKLSRSAKNKANDLCSSKGWSHTDSKGREFQGFVEDAGYKYEHAGENLAQKFDTDEGAFKALLKSPTHLKNIEGEYKDIGIGRNYCKGRNIIVTHFAK